MVETRLLHKMHRAATSLLVEAAQRDAAPSAALEELRDFVVAALRHHHESEDDVLWPQLTAADSAAATGLAELAAEHDAVDAALDALSVAPVRADDDRAALVTAAVAVRDLVHTHLDHARQPVLFPALTTHMSDEAWARFSRAVIASAPPCGRPPQHRLLRTGGHSRRTRGGHSQLAADSPAPRPGHARTGPSHSRQPPGRRARKDDHHMTSTLVVGGSGGLGEVIARHFADRGDDVIVTSRDKARAEATAARIGAGTRGLALDLGRPETIGAALADVTEVDHVVITAVGQAANSLAQFNVTDAVAAVTMKLVGYAETVRVLRDRFTPAPPSFSSAGSPRNARTPARPSSAPSTPGSPAWCGPSPWRSPRTGSTPCTRA